jgi:hypothetical protein
VEAKRRTFVAPDGSSHHVWFFSDDRAEADIPEDEEWTSLQREVLEDFCRAVLDETSD